MGSNWSTGICGAEPRIMIYTNKQLYRAGCVPKNCGTQLYRVGCVPKNRGTQLYRAGHVPKNRRTPIRRCTRCSDLRKAEANMSFSGEVKEELSRLIPEARHCQLAELAAITGMCGSVCISASGRWSLKFHTENISVARKCFTLLQKTFNICSDVSVRLHKGDISALRENKA